MPCDIEANWPLDELYRVLAERLLAAEEQEIIRKQRKPSGKGKDAKQREKDNKAFNEMIENQKRNRLQVDKELDALYKRVIAEAELNPAEREQINLERQTRRESIAKVMANSGLGQ